MLHCFYRYPINIVCKTSLQLFNIMLLLKIHIQRVELYLPDVMPLFPVKVDCFEAGYNYSSILINTIDSIVYKSVVSI